jgi:hypothetical protein
MQHYGIFSSVVTILGLLCIAGLSFQFILHTGARVALYAFMAMLQQSWIFDKDLETFKFI